MENIILDKEKEESLTEVEKELIKSRSLPPDVDEALEDKSFYPLKKLSSPHKISAEIPQFQKSEDIKKTKWWKFIEKSRKKHLKQAKLNPRYFDELNKIKNMKKR